MKDVQRKEKKGRKGERKKEEFGKRRKGNIKGNYEESQARNCESINGEGIKNKLKSRHKCEVTWQTGVKRMRGYLDELKIIYFNFMSWTTPQTHKFLQMPAGTTYSLLSFSLAQRLSKV